MEMNDEKEQEIIFFLRKKYDICEEESYRRIYENIAPRNSFDENKYGIKPISEPKKGWYITSNAQEIKKDLDTFFPRSSGYGSVVEKIADKKIKGIKLHEEIMVLKETVNNIEKQKINILENENKILKRNMEDMKDENIKLEKRMRLLEEKNNNNGCDIKKEETIFLDDNDNNNQVHLNHCSNITINMIENNNKKDDQDNLFFHWFNNKLEKTNHKHDFETVDNVLSQYNFDVHKCISSKKLGQEMFRIGVGAAKRKTLPDGSRPYCYVGIRFKDKKKAIIL